MKPHGVKKKDRGCCPGHDKFPGDRYSSRRSERAYRKATKVAHRRARAWSAIEIRTAIAEAS